ncbi:hypothetical protein JW926_09270 [Candidatus Sumerlaeota bacterium]|nr:hypothetical protein [Candidatus Sumerlaeota bacterium]
MLGYEKHASESFNPPLSPIELYILLSSVLFHDIGRTKETGKTKGNITKETLEKEMFNHAEESKKIIKERYTTLGIPSSELASSIGKICYYHDPRNNDLARKDLSNIVISPYGRVRELLLASLLFLADHMDSAFTRVLPPYLRSDSSLEEIGAFRRLIQGVHFDPKARMIVTALSDISRNNDAKKNGNSEKDAKPFFDALELKAKEDANTQEELEKYVNGKKIIDEIKEKYIGYNKLKENLKHCSKISDVQLLKSAGLEIKDFNKIETLISKGLLNVRYTGKIRWPVSTLVAMVLGDVRSNDKALSKIRDDLEAMGIPIQKWFVEYKEKLYDESGKETIEPIFTHEYLEDVAKNMWDLSLQIFGSALFTFENLADSLSDPDIDRVRRAVKRISNLSRNASDNKDETKEPIWVGSTHWKWNVFPSENAKSGKQNNMNEFNPCKFYSLKYINDIIDKIRTKGEGK